MRTRDFAYLARGPWDLMEINNGSFYFIFLSYCTKGQAHGIQRVDKQGQYMYKSGSLVSDISPMFQNINNMVDSMFIGQVPNFIN